MEMETVPLGKIAYARRGDKGANANVGVVAHSPAAFEWLKQVLTPDKVQAYFKPLGVIATERYELPHLLAFNFVLKGVLGLGGSRELRVDAQGKALGQALLEMPIQVPSHMIELPK